MLTDQDLREATDLLFEGSQSDDEFNTALPEYRAIASALHTKLTGGDTNLADAERYRWLRHTDNDELLIRRMGAVTTPYLPRNQKLDAIIDALMDKDRYDPN